MAVGRHLGTIWASVGLDTAPLGAGAARTRRMMYALDATMGASAKGMQRTLGSVFMGFAKSATAAAVIVGGVAVKMAADFESAMREVWSLTTESEAKFKEWSKTTLDMSKDLPILAKDLAKGLYWVKSAMPDVSDAQMFNVLDVAAKGSVGALGSLDDTVKALTGTMNAYKDVRPEHYMDIMTKAVERGSLTMQDFASNVGKVIGTASDAKVPFEQVAAAVSTLTKAGIPAETAFMALNRVMVQYYKPSEDAKKVGKELGIEFSRSHLQAVGLAGAMQEVMAAFEKAPDEIGRLFPNIRAIKAVFPLAGAAAQLFAKDLKEVGGAAGTTNRMFSRNMKSMENQIKTTLNKLRAALISLGEKLFPTVQKALDALGRAFEGKNAAVNMFVKAISGAISVVKMLGGAILDFTPALVVLGGAFAAIKVGAFLSSITQVSAVMAKLASMAPSLAALFGSISLGSIALAAAPAIVGISLLVKSWKDADRQGEKAQDVIWKNDKALKQLGMDLKPMVERYQELRDNVERTAAEEQEFKDIQNEIAVQAPMLADGIDKQGQAILKSDDALNDYIDSLLRYGGISITTKGEPGKLEGLIKLQNQANDAAKKMRGSIDAVSQALMGFKSVTFTPEMMAGAIQLLSTNYDAGAESIWAYIIQEQQAGNEAAKNTQKFGELAGIVQSVERDYAKYGMTLAEAEAEVRKLQASIDDLKESMATAAYQAGATGQGLTDSVINALKSRIPQINQVGRDIAAQTALGMLDAAGVPTEAATQLAQVISNQIATGNYADTGSDVGNQVRDEIVKQLQELNIADEISAAGQAVDLEIEAQLKGETAEQDAEDLRDRLGWIFGGAITQNVETSADTQKARDQRSIFEQIFGVTIVQHVTVQPNPAKDFAAEARLINREMENNLEDQHVRVWFTLGGGAVAPAMPFDTTSIDALGASLNNVREILGANVPDSWMWRMENEDILRLNQSIMYLTGNNQAAVDSFNTLKAQFLETQASLESYKTQIDDCNQAIEDSQDVVKGYNEQLEASNERLSKANKLLSDMQSIRIKGEVGVEARAFADQQKINRLKLQIMQAEDKYDYAKAAALQKQLDLTERQAEEAALAAGLKYDPMRKKIEQALDPLSTTEKTYQEIIKNIKNAQGSITRETAVQDNLNKKIKEQTEYQDKVRKKMEQLQKYYDFAFQQLSEIENKMEKVANDTERAAQAAKTFADEVDRAAKAGEPAPTWNPMGFQHGGYVPRTGPAIVHKGEYVIPAGQMKMRPLSLYNTNSTTVSVPVYLDSRQIAHATTRVIGRQASAYHRSGARI